MKQKWTTKEEGRCELRVAQAGLGSFTGKLNKQLYLACFNAWVGKSFGNLVCLNLSAKNVHLRMSCSVILDLPWHIIKQKKNIWGLAWTSVEITSSRVMVLKANKLQPFHLTSQPYPMEMGKQAWAKLGLEGTVWAESSGWKGSAPWSLKKVAGKAQTGVDENTFAKMDDAVVRPDLSCKRPPLSYSFLQLTLF